MKWGTIIHHYFDGLSIFMTYIGHGSPYMCSQTITLNNSLSELIPLDNDGLGFVRIIWNE